MLRVLTRLVALEPRQDDLLGRIIASPCIDADALGASGALSEGSADESEGAVSLRTRRSKTSKVRRQGNRI